MRAVLLVLACAGCDQVVGLDEPLAPCARDSFGQATVADVTFADDATVSTDLSIAVLSREGMAFEMALPDGVPVPLDLTPYMPESLALSPEGTSMLFTAAIEPPTLFAAARASDGTWRVDSNVPPGIYAGTPSADVLGPRRVLVRMFGAEVERDGPPLQEYEDIDGVWTPVGDRRDYPGDFAPNLTPDALTMVYAGKQADGTPAVFQASRSSRQVWFDAPVAILAGAHADPQLVDRCGTLYTIDPNPDAMPPPEGQSILRRYDR